MLCLLLRVEEDDQAHGDLRILLVLFFNLDHIWSIGCYGSQTSIILSLPDWERERASVLECAREFCQCV